MEDKEKLDEIEHSIKKEIAKRELSKVKSMQNKKSKGDYLDDNEENVKEKKGKRDKDVLPPIKEKRTTKRVSTSEDIAKNVDEFLNEFRQEKSKEEKLNNITEEGSIEYLTQNENNDENKILVEENIESLIPEEPKNKNEQNDDTNIIKTNNLEEDFSFVKKNNLTDTAKENELFNGQRRSEYINNRKIKNNLLKEKTRELEISDIVKEMEKHADFSRFNSIDKDMEEGIDTTSNQEIKEEVPKNNYLEESNDGKKALFPKRHKKKLKKWVYIVFILLLMGIAFGIYYHNDLAKKAEELRIAKEKEEKLKDIESHYNKYVKTNNKVSLYKLENTNYKEIGSVSQDVFFELEDENITLDTQYFKIKDLGYYVSYSSVDKSEKQEKNANNRYKKYLPFNLNIVTNDHFTIYVNDQELYSFNESMSFPIIINNYEGKYYVEYQDQLVNIKKEDVKEVIKADNTTKKNQSKITTLCYHRVYDTNEKCTDPYVCIKKSSFDQEMKYLSDNNYLTLTMEELYMYLKGIIQVEKATVLTFDDGYLYQSAEDVLDKYDLNGTMFVISGHFKDLDKFKNLKRLAIQSHTDSMHRNYVCQGGNQGGAILCASKSEIKKDLETSLEKLGVKPIGLAFPFYDYNDKAISVLKEVGFKMSFIGRAGQMGKATPNKTDLYRIPRMTVWEQSIMSFSKWKSYL